MDVAISPHVRNLKRLVWLYFWLMMVEGTLRKWFFVRYSNQLLIVRDPILILLYAGALRWRLFPRNNFIRVIIFFSFISFVTGIFYSHGALLVILYGIRANYLHLPLIFLIPKLFNINDVMKVGRWIILLSIPMSILIMFQFLSPSDHILNRTVGAGGQLLHAARGKIRPSGTFSFSTGPAQYYPGVISFLLYGQLRKGLYNNLVLILVIPFIVMAVACSGSRSLIATILTVFILFAYVIAVRPAVLKGFLKFIVLFVIIILAISSQTLFKEGTGVLKERFSAAGGTEGGMLARILSSYTVLAPYFYDAPVWGVGVGVGTNVGAKLLTGQVVFLLAEGEWGRILLESGIIIGPLYILLRILMISYLWRVSAREIKRDNFLPFLLFTAGAWILLNGQLSQPATLGFCAFYNGICLAACNIPKDS